MAEDILMISSNRSQAAELWVTYLKSCFDQIRKKYNKPPFRIVNVGIEELEGPSPISQALEERFKNVKLEIMIICPVFLEHISQCPEVGAKLTQHVEPDRVLAMLLGVEEAAVYPQHKSALATFPQWKKMLSVKDRDEKFVTDFLGAAINIISKQTNQQTQTTGKYGFVLMPKKVNKSQNKVLVLLNEAVNKEDVIRVTISRNNESCEIFSVKKINPYLLIFRMPEECLTVSMLFNVTVEKNGTSLGSKMLKSESQLHALDQILRSCDAPVEFMCQALDIAPYDKEKLDDILVSSIQRNMPPNFNLLRTSGLGSLHRGVISEEEYPTLLHFAARFGLEKLCWTLLECPGGELACDIRNACELTPAEMAESAGYTKLANVLCGYMQMTEFTSVYTFLKGMTDEKPSSRKSDTSDDYLNPRPLSETYQVPPSPRPLPNSHSPLGYMPMQSPPSGKSRSPIELYIDENMPSSSRDSPKNATDCKRDDASLKRSRENSGNGFQDELIEIINDFKSNIFTISEVEKLVEDWRNRNDVQQSFREKQDQLNKMREEYERVQQRMKDEMRQIGRPSPIERIKKFFRGKSKEAKRSEAETVKKAQSTSDNSYCYWAESTLSIRSSSSSSSGRLSTGSHCSGTSLGDSGTHSDVESERKFRCSRRSAKHSSSENYDVPPSPVSLLSDQQKQSNGILNYDVPPSPALLSYLSNEFSSNDLDGLQLNTPPSSVLYELDSGLLASSNDKYYCNLSSKDNLIANESTLHGRLAKTTSKKCLKTVEEHAENTTEENPISYEYINLPDINNQVQSKFADVSNKDKIVIHLSSLDIHVPEYVNVETSEMTIKCK